MKSKVKFLWIYTAILFSFALILIIFAYLTQNNISKENEAITKNMSGYKSSIENLTKENEKLHKELEEMKVLLDEEKEKTASYYEVEKNDNIGEITETNALIKNSLDEYLKGNKNKAREIIKNIDRTKIGDLQIYIADKINE